MTYKERKRREEEERKYREAQMHREINTKNFELAFKIWCAFHPHCWHCIFRKSFGGCVELYFKTYYHPELWDESKKLPF